MIRVRVYKKDGKKAEVSALHDNAREAYRYAIGFADAINLMGGCFLPASFEKKVLPALENDGVFSFNETEYSIYIYNPDVILGDPREYQV